MQTNDKATERFTVPNIPACVGDPAHNFQPLSEKMVYCTKCSAVVRFTKPKDKK